MCIQLDRLQLVARRERACGRLTLFAVATMIVAFALLALS